MLVAALQLCVGVQMMDLIVHLLPALVKLTSSATKVVSSSAEQALLSVTTDPSMLPLINRITHLLTRSTHRGQRKSCMLVVRHILRVHAAECLLKYKGVLQQALQSGEGDKLSEIREMAKDARNFFNFHFQAVAEDGTESVFPAMPTGAIKMQ